MENEDKDKGIEHKEENNMPSTAKKMPQDHNPSALIKISSKAQILTGPKGMIKLNPKDHSHRDWYNDVK